MLIINLTALVAMEVKTLQFIYDFHFTAKFLKVLQTQLYILGGTLGGALVLIGLMVLVLVMQITR